MAIINGRRVSNVPDSGVYGHELLDELKPGRARRPVLHRSGNRFETVEPGKLYPKRELLDKKGRPVRIETIPDRTKGATFGAPRTALSKRIVTEQVYDLAEHLFKQGLDFDEDNADWLVVPRYRLPDNWRHIASSSPLLVTLPTEYPVLPPVGFYLKADVPQSANGHLYANAYHEAWKEPLEHGWKWYCVYVHAGTWQPAPVRRPGDWKRGDNLWTYFMLIDEALASND